MLINAIITAKAKGAATTFGAQIMPVQKGDIIIYNNKEFTVTSVKQKIEFNKTQCLIVEIEHKENLASLFN